MLVGLQPRQGVIRNAAHLAQLHETLKLRQAFSHNESGGGLVGDHFHFDWSINGVPCAHRDYR